MNFLLCVLNHVTRIFHIVVLYSAIILMVNWKMLGPMCDMEFEKRHIRNSNPSRAVRTHYCKHIDNFTLEIECESWSCWESQLRDHFRIAFLNVYNDFRSSVAQQECHECKYYDDIPVMIQLEWHWELEKESQNAIKYCPDKDFKTNMKININDVDETNSLECEMAAASFPILSGTQDELIRILPSLLYGNYLHDFNSNNKYRRNLALYIGCSYIPRVLDSTQMHSSNPTLKHPIGHILCYYCSREKTIHSGTNDPTNCPAYTTKTNTNDFPLLCKLTTNRITLPCESTIIPCPTMKKTYSWIYPHLIDMVAQLDNGTNLPMADYLDKFNLMASSQKVITKNQPPYKPNPPIKKQETPYIIHEDPYDKKFCIIVFLIFIFILLLLISVILLISRYHLVHRQRIAAVMTTM